MMKYLVNYVWNNTRGNHAGFFWMSQMLQKFYSDEYIVIAKYCREKRKIVSNNFFNRCLNYIDRFYHGFTYDKALAKMFKTIKEKDTVFLLNYCHAGIDQMSLAKAIKKLNPRIKVLAMVHLTPSLLEKSVLPEEINEWTSYVDCYLTLGSSLTRYLVQTTFNSVPVYTLFHPVDTSYFFPVNVAKHDVNVIVFGNLQRNYKKLRTIIRDTPDVHYIICAGFVDCSELKTFKNTSVFGYIPEKKLRNLLLEADISLNVMDDTVGSNVITISMAMGLAIVVSDVGSIRDYCSEDNALFCRSTDEFVSGIKYLVESRDVLERMKRASLEKTKLFSIKRFHEELVKLS